MGDELLQMKRTAAAEIDANSETLAQLSNSIWEHPELDYKEKHAHDVLTRYLKKAEFKVESHYFLETAFRAEYGETGNGPNIAVLYEYDALPDIGHACGHNLIAEAGVAAAIGIKAAMASVTKPLGMLTVLGTPSEEGSGGKIDLINAGAFKNVDIAMMVHPTRLNLYRQPTLAIKHAFFRFSGKAAHASSSPWSGVNALDAAVLAYQNISCLRQQMKPTWRVEGIISKGGIKPNIIPDFTELEYEFRTPTSADLSILESKVLNCFEAAATATGCKLDYTFDANFFTELVINEPLASAFAENARTLGVRFHPPEVAADEVGSTDMGNVSYEVPSIHPFYSITDVAANHTKEFTVAAGDPQSQAPTLTQAKAMAYTALDVFTRPELFDDIRKHFKKDIGGN